MFWGIGLYTYRCASLKVGDGRPLTWLRLGNSSGLGYNLSSLSLRDGYTGFSLGDSLGLGVSLVLRVRFGMSFGVRLMLGLGMSLGVSLGMRLVLGVSVRLGLPVREVSVLCCKASSQINLTLQFL